MDYRIPKNGYQPTGVGQPGYPPSCGTSVNIFGCSATGGADGGNGITGGISGVGKVTIKPPNGVMPKRFWDKQRISDLSEAVRRYLDTDLEIPLEWVSELNDLRRGQHDGD